MTGYCNGSAAVWTVMSIRVHGSLHVVVARSEAYMYMPVDIFDLFRESYYESLASGGSKSNACSCSS